MRTPARWRSLTGGWDRSVARLGATPDGKTLLASVEESGQEALYRVDPKTGARARLVASGTVAAYTATASAWCSHARTSADRTTCTWSGLAWRAGTRVTDVNHEFARRAAHGRVRAVQLQRLERRDRIRLRREASYGFAPGQHFPVAFVVHGGPQVSFGNLWTYRWNAQAFAGGG